MAMRNVFFLESISTASMVNEETTVSLFDASRYLEASTNEPAELEDAIYFSTITVPSQNFDTSLQAGFVHYEDGQLVNGNGTSTARHFLWQNTRLRQTLIENSTTSFHLEPYSDSAFSYHVNVGHGNCSFIFDPVRSALAVVDCSKYDYLEHKSYRQNILDCLQHIRTTFKVTNLHAELLVLTHPHYDHYSGIEDLIMHRVVDSHTIMYLNQYYSMPSPTLNKLIQRIGSLQATIVEPIVSNSNPLLSIIHPEKRLVKTETTVYNNLDPIIDRNPNNASIVFGLHSAGGSFTFTGDIEEAGWNRIVGCSPLLMNNRYYAVSHHGSENGHLRTQCPCGVHVTSVADCLPKQAQPVIMGRKNAYSGIPSKMVTTAFPNAAFSQMDSAGIAKKFLEIEWKTGMLRWH